MKKPSFFSRLTGSGDEYEDYFEEDSRSARAVQQDEEERHMRVPVRGGRAGAGTNDASIGELSVDVYQTPDYIVVKALIAGVQPGSVDISLTREMLTISGSREEEREVEDDGYFQRELYWGSFSRTIVLPEEIDVDMAEANEKHGVLVIRLPKINKKRETKLKVRSR